MLFLKCFSGLLILCSLAFGSLAAKDLEIYSPELNESFGVMSLEKDFSPDLYQLSDWLCILQKELHDVGQIDKIWIGGGSARAILDHLYFDKTLTMRDLDVFAVAKRRVTAEYVEQFGRDLGDEAFGFFSTNDLRNRPRVPNDKPVLVRNDYVAGWGLHWIRSNGEILDLSVYHSQADLDLNGIFDIDTVMIPLAYDETVVDFATRLREVSYEELVAEGKVYDRYGGYDQWTKGEIKIVNWLDIESDPLLKVMRVVRTLFKMNRDYFTQEEQENFGYLLDHAEVKNPLQMTRNLLKVLEDDRAEEELRLLQEAKLFKKWLKPLDGLDIALKEAPELDYGRGNRAALGKLYAMMYQIEGPHQRLSAIVETMEPFDLAAGAAWAFEELFDQSPCDVESVYSLVEEAPHFREDLRKIAASSVLPKEEKQLLFLRAIFRGNRGAETEQRVMTAFPEIDHELVISVAREADFLRKGIVTGVFNPVHLGHVEMIREALDEMALDEIILVPTEEVGNFEKPISWNDRYTMLSLAAADIERARVIPPEYHELLKVHHDVAIRTLKEEEPESVWVKVIGSDYFQALSQAGKDPLEECDHLLVVQRDQIPLFPHEALKEGKVFYKAHQMGEDGHQQSHLGKRARQLARSESKDLSEAVPKSVADYIAKRKLYQSHPQMSCLTTNGRKMEMVKRAFPNCEQIAIDIPNLSLLSPEKMVKMKMDQAMALRKEPLMVIEHFIKIKAISDHFIPITDLTFKSLGPANIATLMETKENNEVTFLTIVGLIKKDKEVELFSERVKGTLNIDELKQASYLDVESFFTPLDTLYSLLESHPLEQALFKVKNAQMPQKIGFLTGVFNPIHHGHLQSALKAKEAFGLDKVILIPTPATNHNEKPIAWEERVAMAELATQAYEGVEVISPSYKPDLVQGTTAALEKLFQAYPGASWYQIMGSDSYIRFVEQGRLEKALEDEHHSIVVFERPGYEVEVVDLPRLHFLPSDSGESASSVVRDHIQKAQSITGLVPKEVEHYILDYHIYVQEAA